MHQKQKIISKYFLSKEKFIQSPNKHYLDLYHDPEIKKILETRGERNVWTEVQHIFSEKKSRILDIACDTGKDYGWIENYQSYFNNSQERWSTLCEKVSPKYKFIVSSLEDEISIVKWIIVKKND